MLRGLASCFCAIISLSSLANDSVFPSSIITNYALDEEMGWEFLVLSLPKAQNDVIGVDLVIYSESQKISMSRLGFVQSLNQTDHLVTKVLVNPYWSAGRYTLVVHSRAGDSGITTNQVFDVKELLQSVKAR